MARIHNNPKLEGPRMPLILSEEMEEKWLQDIEGTQIESHINELIQSYPDNSLGGIPCR